MTICSALEENGLSAELTGLMHCLAQRSVETEISSGTSITTVEEAARVHIADSLAVFGTAWLDGVDLLIDIGSGLGFPGLAVAAAQPRYEVSLLDGARKKAEAAARIARQCGIGNVSSLWGRAEELGVAESPHCGSYGIVMARALAPLAVLAEYAAPLLRVGGSLIAWKGVPGGDETAACGNACETLGLELHEPHIVAPFPGSGERSLWRARKLADTPPGFPRRAGVAARDPLGS